MQARPEPKWLRTNDHGIRRVNHHHDPDHHHRGVIVGASLDYYGVLFLSHQYPLRHEKLCASRGCSHHKGTAIQEAHLQVLQGFLLRQLRHHWLQDLLLRYWSVDWTNSLG